MIVDFIPLPDGIKNETLALSLPPVRIKRFHPALMIAMTRCSFFQLAC